MNRRLLEGLLKDGFSEKYASYYLNLAEEEYDNPAYSKEFVDWAHDRGFWLRALLHMD